MKPAVLDRQSFVPLCYQIQHRFLDQIRSGVLKAGQLLPSEQKIADCMGVSRMTARQALKALCSLGVAYSERGRGTFVSRTKLEKNFRQLLSFSEEMRLSGSRPRSTVLTFKKTHPDSQVGEALHISRTEEVFLLRRVRLADSVPLCIECTHVPVRLCPDLQSNLDPAASLYRTLREHYGIQIEIADEVAEASLASAEEARLLRIRKKAPVFRFTRTAYFRSGEPIEFVKSVYRGDRCRVVNRLIRQTRLGAEGSI
ncbi:MAG TPA: GntR family transcriptional regulator [Candidatus Angelobacter sp.]|nr:GntR family transcriptional regulator [Candidatus Angelobacter sp.]